MQQTQDLANIFKALSDINRLKLLKLLEQGELCVCALVEAMAMRQSHVSFHLGVLKKAGFLNTRRCGKWQNYSLNYQNNFLRFLLYAVLESLSTADVEQELARLRAFLKNNPQQKNGIQGGQSCRV